MINLIKTNVILPLLGRAGTASGIWLISLGVHETAANQIVLGATAAALILLDLGSSWLGRWLARKKVV